MELPLGQSTSTAASLSCGFLSNLKPWPLRAAVFLMLVGLCTLLPWTGAPFLAALMLYEVVSSLHVARRDGVLGALSVQALPIERVAWLMFKATVPIALYYGSVTGLAQMAAHLMLRRIGLENAWLPVAFFPTVSFHLQFLALDLSMTTQRFFLWGVALATITPFSASICSASIGLSCAYKAGSTLRDTVRAWQIWLAITVALAVVNGFIWMKFGLVAREASPYPLSPFLFALILSNIVDIAAYLVLARYFFLRFVAKLRTQPAPKLDTCSA